MTRAKSRKPSRRIEPAADSTNKTAGYAAFLRGINVGGHKVVRMEDVRRAFEKLGFGDVRTLLASGNVVFRAPPAGRAALEKKIQQRLRKSLGQEIRVVVRTMAELAALAAVGPFDGIRATPNTRLFVTFVSEKPRTRLKIPYRSPDGSFRILHVFGRDVCSVLLLGPQWSRNLRQMDVLEDFGPTVTTRSWSTVEKVLRAGAE